MHSIGGLLLGIIDIGIVVAVLLLAGLLVEWLLALFQGPAIPAQVRKMYLIIVCLIALYMLVSLILGFPTLRLIGR